MKNKSLAIGVLILLGVLMVLASPTHRALAQPGDVAELKVTIREWSVPTKGAHPHDPAVGPDGALWFTEQMSNKLGRLDPKTGKFKEYPLVSGKNSGPHGLVADQFGNIWYTANFGGYIGKLDPNTGKVTEYQMPNKRADDPHTAVFDAFGMLWFTVQGGNMVGKLDPNTGRVILKEVPTEAALPYGIQVTNRGLPVFCELGTHKIGTINTVSLEIKEYDLPESARPRRLAVAADDTVYFTDFKGGNLGKLNLATGDVQMYPSPGGPESNPYGIAITPDGMVWYSESGVQPNTIIRFDPKTGKLIERVPFTINLSAPYDNIVTDDGNLWAGGSAAGGGDTIELFDTRTKKLTEVHSFSRDSTPARGGFDAQSNPWFGGRGGALLELDMKTKQIREFVPPTPYVIFYEAMPDKRGEVWAGELHGGRMLRFNPKSEHWTEYVLPEPYSHDRRTWIDNSTTPVTVWYVDHNSYMVRVQARE